MAKVDFEIDDNGSVYHLNGQGRKPLGHIASLNRERSRLAEEFQAWWREQLADAEPLALIKRPPVGDNGVARIAVPETVQAVGGDADELVEALAAD